MSEVSSLVTADHFRYIAEHTTREDAFLADARFKTASLRSKNRRELNALIGEYTCTRTCDTLIR